MSKRLEDQTDEEKQARERSKKRWLAVEAFNFAPGLSPTARRLGVALITEMNSTTFDCFPGEKRLAVLLDVTVRAVQKAKAELRSALLVFWSNRGGNKHSSRYAFDWDRLEDLAKSGKDRATSAKEQRRLKPERQFVLEGNASSGKESQTRTPIPANLNAYSGYNPNASSPFLSHCSPQVGPHSEFESDRKGSLVNSKCTLADPGKVSSKVKGTLEAGAESTAQHGEQALKEKTEPTGHHLPEPPAQGVAGRRYYSLNDAFHADITASVVLERLSPEDRERVSRVLDSDGIRQARHVLQIIAHHHFPNLHWPKQKHAQR
jgi:hypothetical protein